ncbi:CHAT domain-containing protein [Chroococcidiopsis sp. FACHB-1243]|nr:CHAT domain-containing protein [Chroococcidiopsis sp. [FACHB-1243]]
MVPNINGRISRLTFPSAQAVESPAERNQPDAQALLDRGRELYKSGQYSATITVLQQAASAFQATGDKLKQAIALSNLSLAYQQLGQWEKAAQAIASSLDLLGYSVEKRAGEQGGQGGQKSWGSRGKNRLSPTTNYHLPIQNLKILAQTLEIQGDLQLKLGQAALALETWQQAASIYDRLDDKVAIARTLINQSLARQSLGFYRQALATLEQVSQTLGQQPDSLLKAIALRNLGDVLQLVGNLEQSMKVLQQSLDLAKRLKSPSEISTALLSLGNTERAWGNRVRMRQNVVNEDIYPSLRCNISQPDGKLSPTAVISSYQKAERYYQEAAIASPLPTSQIQAKVNQINVLLELQQRSQIQKIWTNLQSELTNLSPSHATIFAQINLAQSLGCLKHAAATNAPTWTEIAQIFATAIQQARSIGDVRSQAYALGALGGLYLESQDLSDDAQTLHESSLQSAQELTKQALILAQSIQANDIVYLWQWQSGYLLKLQGDLKGAIASYTEAVNTLQSLRSDLVALNPDIQFSFRNSVEPVYRQLVDLLLRSSCRDARVCAPNNNPIARQNLQQARNAIEALQLTELENFFREACLQAKPKQIDEVVDKTDPTAAVIYPIILPDRLEVIVKLPNQTELRHYTTYRSRQEIENSIEKLQSFLVEPDRINDIKELSQQVYDWLIQPFTTEFDRQRIKTLVFVLDGSLRNIPMAVLYDKQQKQYLIEKYAIALAPGLQLVDPRPLQRRRLNALIAGISEKRQIAGRNFSPLENVVLELQQVQTKLPSSEELFNQDFTKQNIQNQIDSSKFSVVHIATHGEFSSNAEETFILAWEQLIKVKDFDKLLQLSGQRQPKAIELLVLSACQTAAGDRQAALGLAGIAVRAGARSTLATLWSVDDRSTAELMTHFYQELENATTTKAEALRRAQLTLLKNYEIPYFWAAYVLVGNWL